MGVKAGTAYAAGACGAEATTMRVFVERRHVGGLRPSDEVSIRNNAAVNSVGPTLLTSGGALPLPTIVGSSTDVDVPDQVGGSARCMPTDEDRHAADHSVVRGAVPPVASRMSGESKSMSSALRAARLAFPANWCW